MHRCCEGPILYFELPDGFASTKAHGIQIQAPTYQDHPIPIAYPAYPNLWGIDWPTAISIALALASALFALVAILLVLAGIMAYYDVKAKSEAIAEKTARETAEKIALEVAERVANQAVQEKITAILVERASVPSTDVSAPDADRIAREQT